MGDKVELKEKLAAVDMNFKALWDEMDDDNKKALKQEFFILNRYISNVASSKRDVQEHFVLTVNEFFNKHWNSLQKHPKLMWMLLCMCNYDGKQIFFHQWIGHKKKDSAGNGKLLKFLQEIYPNRRDDELELLADTMTKAEAKELAKSYGYDDKQVTKMLG